MHIPNRFYIPKQMWNFVGDDDGPVVTVLGGTHGNELPGIELVRRVLRRLEVSKDRSRSRNMTGIRGQLNVGFGNPDAILLRERGVSTVRDLNRSFVKEDMEDMSREWADLWRARELRQMLEQTDFLIDIHATQGMPEGFLCMPKYELAFRRYYELVPCAHILTDPENVLGHDMGINEPGTTDSFVVNHGGSGWLKGGGWNRPESPVALVYETGELDDLSTIEMIEGVVGRLLLEFGVATPTFLERAGLHEMPNEVWSNKKILALTRCIKPKGKGFRYADGIRQIVMKDGKEVGSCPHWLDVKKGDVLGHYDDGTEEVIPEDGCIAFTRPEGRITADQSFYYTCRVL